MSEYVLTEKQQAMIEEELGPLIAAGTFIRKLLASPEMYLSLGDDSLIVDGWVVDLTPDEVDLLRRMAPEGTFP